MSEEWPPRISFWRRPALIGLTFLHPTQATRECISYVRSDTGGFYGKSIRQIDAVSPKPSAGLQSCSCSAAAIGHGLAEVYGKSERGAVVVGALGGLDSAVGHASGAGLEHPEPRWRHTARADQPVALSRFIAVRHAFAVIAASWSYFAPGP